MSGMARDLQFSSDRFLPYLPEHCQENPGVYGFELAHFLSRALMQKGIPTSYPLGEDWGWLIEHVDGAIEISIACSSESEADEGYAGRPIGWRVVISERASRGLFFRRKSSADEGAVVHRLADAIADLLRTEGIAVRQDGDAPA